MALNPKIEAAKLALQSGNSARAHALLSSIEAEGKDKFEVVATALFELSKLEEKDACFAAALKHTKRAALLEPKLDYQTAAFRLEKHTEVVKKALDKKVEDLKLELKIHSADLKKLAELNTELAQAYRDSDVRLKAIEHYYEAIANTVALRGEQNEGEGDETGDTPDLELAALQGSIGYCYYELGEYEKAINSYKNALDHGDKEKPDTDIISALAWCYYKKKEFKAARDLFEEAHDIDKNKADVDSQQLIKNLKNLAWTYYELNKRRVAEEKFIEVIELRKKVLTRHRVDIADDYILLGWFYYDRACSQKTWTDFRNSAKKFNLALRRLEKVFGENNDKAKYIRNWLEEIDQAKVKNKKKPLMWLFE